MKIRTLFGLAVITQFTGISCSQHQAETKPNILILLTDDQRYDMMSAVNQQEVKTPNIDKLVHSGVSFSNAYILGAPHAAVCSPSRAMLMTGKHYFNIPGTVHTQWAFPKEEQGKCDLITFPEYFKQNGYTTFATGKQHNGKDWIERGFDKGKSLFMGGMSTHFNLPLVDYNSGVGWGKSYRLDGKFSSELFADAAVEFISSSEQENPFLMYVSFTAPHDPRTAPEMFHDQYPAENISLPSNFMTEHPFPIANNRIRDELLAEFPRSEKEIKKHIANYYAMISATDFHIGRILDALKASGKMDNTIIVFTSDNGLAVGQHGLMGKQSVYEHSIKVPFVFCGKGIPKGKRKDALVYLHDLFPTLCELSDLPTPKGIDTKSISKIIKGEVQSVREAIHFAYHAYERDNYKDIPQLGAHRAIRKGKYKLIISKMKDATTKQLFNLQTDPFECHDLSGIANYQSFMEELELELKNLINKTNDPAILESSDFGLYSKTH